MSGRASQGEAAEEDEVAVAADDDLFRERETEQFDLADYQNIIAKAEEDRKKEDRRLATEKLVQEIATRDAIIARREQAARERLQETEARQPWDPAGNYALFLTSANQRPRRSLTLLQEYFPQPDEHILRMLTKNKEERVLFGEENVIPILQNYIINPEQIPKELKTPQNLEFIEQYRGPFEEYSRRRQSERQTARIQAAIARETKRRSVTGRIKTILGLDKGVGAKKKGKTQKKSKKQKKTAKKQKKNRKSKTAKKMVSKTSKR